MIKNSRPSFKTYTAYVYRQLLGKSLSLKPIKDKDCRRYAVLKTTQYKVFWIICYAAAYILLFIPGMPSGLLSLIALPALYIIAVPVRFFFARYVEIKSDLVSTGMCEKATKDTRPSFGAYLEYAFIPYKERLTPLIEDEDGRRYYWNPRLLISLCFFIYSLAMASFWVVKVMGTGLALLIPLTFACLSLLLSPLSLYFHRFKSTDEPDNNRQLGDHESSPVHIKLASGILIATAAAVLVFIFIFISMGSHENETIALDQPPTLNQAYDTALAYTLERCDKAELVDFFVEYEGTDAMLSGEPYYFYLIFQAAPGLLPEPNVTVSFYSYEDDYDMRAYYEEYEEIRPAITPELVTDIPGILAILENELGITLTSDITLIRITPADRPLFWVYNKNECMVEIRRGGQDIQTYIVNIDNKTVRPA